MKKIAAVISVLALLCACVPVLAEENYEPLYTLAAPYGF